MTRILANIKAVSCAKPLFIAGVLYIASTGIENM